MSRTPACPLPPMLAKVLRHGRAVPLRMNLVSICKGDIAAALLLGQCLFWTERTADATGWFYKTARQWEEEIGLTRCRCERARRLLKNLGFLVEKHAGVPRRVYYRAELTAIQCRLLEENRHAGVVEMAPLARPKPTTLLEAVQQIRESERGGLYKEHEMTAEEYAKEAPGERELHPALESVAKELVSNLGVPSYPALLSAAAQAIRLKAEQQSVAYEEAAGVILAAGLAEKGARPKWLFWFRDQQYDRPW